jgi:hypothetical protein
MAMISAGCSPGAYTGGGWVKAPAPAEDGIATFGVNGQARDRDGDGEIDDVTGRLQYNDHANGVAIHGLVGDGGQLGFQLINACIGGECVSYEDENGDPIPSAPIFALGGTYTPIPKSLGPGGTFEVGLVDWGQEGPDEGDILDITLSGGVFDGYSHTAIVQGGNLSHHSR